jgi:hypothetical protein
MVFRCKFHYSVELVLLQMRLLRVSISTTTYYVRAESTTGAPCLANVAAAVSVIP